jgi:hypothetical protein
VLVWVGANNMWNELEVAPDDDLVARLHRALLHSKLYRLGTVLRHTSGHSYEDEAEDDPQKAVRQEAYAEWKRRGRPLDVARRETLLAADMRRMVETSSAYGVPIGFLTYPQVPEPPISDLIERNAHELQVPVVVTELDRERAKADGFRKLQLFVASAGPHPTPTLYRYIVESLTPSVEALVGLPSNSR